MKAVILAGGLGKRLGEITKQIPKPMVKIGGIPLIEHQITLLKKYGITDIILCTGYLPDVIEKYFKDGKNHEIQITYSIEEEPLGSAGCLNLIKQKINGDFILLNGDVMLNMDLSRLIKFHQEKSSDATLVVHPNNHPYDSDLVELGEDDSIKWFLPKPRNRNKYYSNMVNAGAYVLTEDLFEFIPDGEQSDLGKNVFPKMLEHNSKLFGYTTAEYLKDMGTPKRLLQVDEDFKSGRIKNSNLENKRPAIFLDRDGVINYEKNLLHKIEDFELIPGSAMAVKKINESGFLTILITNQPVVARGLCSISDVEEIHKKMETLLGKEGAFLDGIYYCPHHPDKGYPEEDPNYKIKCDCRKPGIGMITKAVKRFNVDVDKSFLIGDSTRDIQCGKKAGIKTICVKTGHGCKDKIHDIKPDYEYVDLLESVNKII